MYQPDSQSPTPRGSLMDFFITAMAFSIILRGLNLDFVIVEFKLRLVGGGGNNGSDVWSIPDRIAQLPEPCQGGVFNDGFVEGHFFGGLGCFGFGRFFNFEAAFSKSRSTRRGCESRNTR